MLVIRKKQQSELCLTATERSELTNPNWLFVFTHVDSEDVATAILTNISDFTARYDLFSFTEGTDASLRTGTHFLKVYEQASPTNLDPEQADKLVHEERALVLLQNFLVKEYKPEVTRDIYEFS